MTVLVVVAATARDPRFLSPQTLDSVLLWLPVLLVVALGQMPVIVTKGIDISVGSTVGLVAFSVGLIGKVNPSLPVPVLFASGLALGALLGSLNAVLVAIAKVPPVVTTIGTLTAFRGMAFLVAQGKQIDTNNVATALTDLGRNGVHLGPITVNWLLWLAFIPGALLAWVLARSAIGRTVYAVGGNPVAAALRGMDVKRILFSVYIWSGACAGLAGVLYLGRYGFVSAASAGVNLELNAIAAVVVGGVPVSGGSGSVLGVLAGCVLLAVVNVGLSVLGIAADWQLLAYGAVVMAALLVDAVGRRAKESSVVAA
ncbi:MAG: ABC transporter permease [Armatimonadetes bacterium]|nr:ABC transporter permease [Armatimonadota bacterium]